MTSEQSTPASPAPCINNCGFFGTAATSNYCSKCYRDSVLKQQLQVSAKVSLDKSQNHKQQLSAASVAKVEENLSVKKTRCSNCNKKTGLLGFDCRCGNTFCSIHRYPEKHNCDFDFKAMGRGELAKANPVVKSDKLEDRV